MDILFFHDDLCLTWIDFHHYTFVTSHVYQTAAVAKM
ncbi:hypothetical protein GCK32_021058, partial [Trichostrongylus colubriformis]